MRVLGVLAAWGVLAVLATMCFALGGSLGYRRGVKDTLTQIRDRRTGAAGCRPLPANHLRRRTSGHARPGARARRARWRPREVGAQVAQLTRAPVTVRSDPRLTALAATLAVVLLLGVPGIAVGATVAQPGESLYSVRRSMEHVRVAFAFGADHDTEVHVELAAARLTDLRSLIGRGMAAEVVGDVSADLGVHARTAADHLPRVGDRSHRSALGRTLRHVVAEQVTVIDEIVALDCGAGADQQDCSALAETKDGSLALKDDTGDVTVAVGDEPETIAQADNDGTVVTAEPVDASEAGDEVAVAGEQRTTSATTPGAGPAGGDGGGDPGDQPGTAAAAPKEGTSTATTQPTAEKPKPTAEKPKSAVSDSGTVAQPESETAPSAPSNVGSPATEPPEVSDVKDGAGDKAADAAAEAEAAAQ